MASVALSEIERKNVVTRLRDWINAVNGFYWLFNVEATVSQALRIPRRRPLMPCVMGHRPQATTLEGSYQMIWLRVFAWFALFAFLGVLLAWRM